MGIYSNGNLIKTPLETSEFVGFLVDDEFQDRQNRKMTSRLRQAQFKENSACVEDIDHHHSRNLKKIFNY